MIARETTFVTGRSSDDGGSGDPSGITAYGVFQGMRAAAEHRWGSPDLRGKRVGVSGVGKVGRLLVDHLVEAGAEVVVTDVSEAAIDRVRAAHPSVRVVADTAELVSCDLDVYAPCALGGALDDATVAALRAEIVCGSREQPARAFRCRNCSTNAASSSPPTTGQLRRAHSGQRRTARVQLRARPSRQRPVRHDEEGVRARRGGRGAAGDRGRPARGTAHGRGVETPDDPLSRDRTSPEGRRFRRRGRALPGQPPRTSLGRGDLRTAEVTGVPASVVPLVLADDLRLRVVLHRALFPAYFLPRLDARDYPGVGHGDPGRPDSAGSSPPGHPSRAAAPCRSQVRSPIRPRTAWCPTAGR